MNGREQKYSVILFIAVGIPSLLILTASFGGVVISQKTYAQQEGQQNFTNLTNNSTSNQTSSIANQSLAGVGSTESQANQTSANQTSANQTSANQTSANQTSANQTGTAALSANMTQSDFESLKQDLTEARQGLENNDTTTVLDELNSASGELFQVISNQLDPIHVEAITQEFNPLQTHIDQAQEEALKDNQTGTTKELSAAESELLKITETLPSS
jgi:uncharacterized membrane protein YccC